MNKQCDFVIKPKVGNQIAYRKENGELTSGTIKAIYHLKNYNTSRVIVVDNNDLRENIMWESGGVAGTEIFANEILAWTRK